MFIGARVAYSRSDTAKFGVAIAVEYDAITVKFDDGLVTKVSPERLQLLNYWKTYKGKKEIGDYKTFPSNTTPEQIFMSKKPIVFGQAGIRAVWYWANNVIYDNKLREPEFKVINSKNYGLYVNSPSLRQISISTACHNFLEFTSTVVHECIHQINVEVEKANLRLQGAHGAAFLRWIPIIKQKTGLNITIKGDASKDETDFNEIDTNIEPKTEPFIFMVFRMTEVWYGVLLKDEYQLSNLSSVADSILSRAPGSSKVYAGRSNLTRVKRALAVANSSLSLPKLKTPFPTSLVKLLENTCTPIAGYRTPEIKEV